MTTMSADPAQSVASSAAVQEETDQEVMSEDSSQSSLTRRVSTLLQDNDSIPGQQCRPLPLDVEDQRKIEEIKRELLLKNPLKVLMSTDTESSTTSGFRVQSLDGSSSSADTYAANRPGNVFLYEPQQSPIVDLTEPSMQCQTQAQTDLEAKVCEIAAREGVRIPTNQALTSITITTCRCSSPSSSPTTLNSTPEPLQLIELSSDQPTAAHLQFQTNEQCTQTNGLFEPPLTTEDQIVSSLSAVEGLTRQETVGGQSAQSSQVSDGEDVQKQRAQASQTHQSSLATTGHVSHVHLTLFPKSTLQTLTSDPFRTSNVAPLLPHRDFAPIRHSSSRGNSPDEGVGSASPQEWSDVREPARLQATRRAAMFRSADPLRIATGTSTIAHRVETSLRVPAAAAPVPLLLPYKPPGSEQLFYMPQTQADVTSTETTMESSHTGSDDAVPPHFNSDILGRRDSGLDRGVSIRHTEGIYSKRLKTNSFKMQDPLSRDAAVAEDETASTSMPSVIHQGPVRRDQGAVRRDQGTSFVPEPAPQLSRLDLLWQMFLEQWVEEKSRPTRDSDVNLVELLERLSHLIDRSRAGRLFHKREEELQGSQQQKRGGTEHRRTARNMEVQGNKESKLRHQTSQSTSFSSSSISQSTDTMCSMSTVDTTRLAQAYGADKVQHLKSSSSLRKLYSTIKKQREEEERWSNDDIITITPSENTNQSAEMDSTLSTSKYVVPAQRGPSKTLAAKRAVKLVNKSIQAGDLEIVSNGTQRHTRDVGTTFPSPVPVRASGQISTSSSSTWRERGAHRSPSKSHRVHRQRKNKKSPGKPYRAGVSWFISGDCVRLEARKENWAEQDMDQSPHTSNGSWIDSYSTESSWREPLRQKQIHQDSNQHNYHHHYHHHHHSDQRNKPVSTGLIPLTLQEALETQRPDFILRSTERMKRLALQAEERRQWMLSHQEREELLTMERRQWLPKPAGSNSQRRAISRKEMIHRSKQIYENLPEVQRRKEEEKRKKDYQSYRLNAKLLNMRITNQVLRKRLNHQQEYYY